MKNIEFSISRFYMRKRAFALFAAVLLIVFTLFSIFAVVAFDFSENNVGDKITALATSNTIDECFDALTNESSPTENVNEEPKYVDYGMNISDVIDSYDAEEDEDEIAASEGYFPIIEENISGQSENKKILFKDKTSKKIDNEFIEKLLNSEYPIEYSSEGPLVLIVHTHTTECYAKEGQKYYLPSNAVAETRSRDNTQNVIAIGETIKEVLEGMGIGVVHCTDYHDIYVFNESYNHSYDSVKKYLKMYPTIKYVIDVHRDSVIHTNNTKVCPVAEIDGKKAAQVMFVIGTNDNGLKHPNWQTNLTVAVKLQNRLIEKYGDLMRPLNIRSGRFNQQLCSGMLLMEFGSCGNTLEQAKYSARLVASEYGKMIKSSE